MKKGFTLLELLIVIGILAILSTTMIIVINPAEMLKKARDSQRIADLSTLKTAISYYITDAAVPSIGATTQCFSSNVTGCTCLNLTASTSTTQVIDGTGWIPIVFTGVTGGSPIANLPQDPNASTLTGNPSRYYVYLTSSTTTNTFTLVANMESIYYSNGGTGNVESTDGGNIDTLYEVGTTQILTATSNNCLPNTGT